MEVEIKVNGQVRKTDVPPETTLLVMLREHLGLTGAKLGCDVGDCGACSVLLDGQSVNACLVLAGQANGRDILTIEGVADDEHLHPLQDYFERLAALQCGFCGPGIILTAKSLLEENPDPSDFEIRDALAGHLCRCTGYTKILEAVSDAARAMREGDNAA